MSKKPIGEIAPYSIPMWARVKIGGLEGYVADRPGPYSIRVRRPRHEDVIVSVSQVDEWQAASSELSAMMQQLDADGMTPRREDKRPAEEPTED